MLGGMTRIVGRITNHSSTGLSAWIRITPSAEWSAVGDDVVAAPVWIPVGADGTVDIEVVVPAGVVWKVEAGHSGGTGIIRHGVVLPRTGTVGLAWLLGLTGDPGASADVTIVISPDGASFTVSAPVVDQDAEAGTFVLEHSTVVDNGDGTFTVDGIQE